MKPLPYAEFRKLEVYRGELLPATCLAHHPNVTFVVEEGVKNP